MNLSFTQSDGVQVDSWPLIADGEQYDSTSKYIVYCAGDQPYEEIVNNDMAEGPSIVVVKESFGNCFIPFLVNHYKNIYVVDYRYLQRHRLRPGGLHRRHRRAAAQQRVHDPERRAHRFLLQHFLRPKKDGDAGGHPLFARREPLCWRTSSSPCPLWGCLSLSLCAAWRAGAWPCPVPRGGRGPQDPRGLPPPSWKIFTLALALRGGMFLLGLGAVVLQSDQALSLSQAVESLCRWDSYHYKNLAELGYSGYMENGPSTCSWCSTPGTCGCCGR